MKNLVAIILMCYCIGSVFAAQPTSAITGEYEVEVQAGETETWTSAVSGTGKLVKKGQGNLVLAAANTFTGGIRLEAGEIHADETGCLGSGEIEIMGQREGYTGPCQIRFTGMNKNFGAPAIHVTGNTTVANPALMFEGTNNVFSGTITADHDLYMGDELMWLYNEVLAKNGSAKWSVDVKSVQMMTFSGVITVQEKFHFLPDATYDFTCPIKAKIFESFLAGDNQHRRKSMFEDQYYGAIRFHNANQIGTIISGFRELTFMPSSTLGGAVLSNMFNYGGAINLRSGSQVAAAIRYSTRTQFSNGRYGDVNMHTIYGNSATTSTLTITGTPDTVVYENYGTLGNNLNGFTLDAKDNPGYVQKFSGRRNKLLGSFVVSNGTVRLETDATFEEVTRLIIAKDGILEIGNTNNIVAFPKVSELEVSGQLKISNGLRPFNLDNISTLRLASDATIESSEDMAFSNVTSFYYDGNRLMRGTWTSAVIPSLPQKVTVVATAGSPDAPRTTLTWTGAASDNLMTSLDNWTTGTAAPTEIDVTHGTLCATIASRGEMVPADGGSRLNSIVDTRDPTNKEHGPMIIGAYGKTLTIDGAAKFVEKGQVILRGTIQSPYGMDQGEATRNGEATFYCLSYNRVKSASPADSIFGYTTACGTPLILDNVTVNKPFSSYGAQAGSEQFYALPNTYNKFMQHYLGGLGGWNVMSVGEGATVEFMGGVTADSRQVKKMSGTVKVSGKPWVALKYSQDPNAGLNLEQGTFIVNVASNAFGSTSTQNKGVRMGAGEAKLEFLKSWGFIDNYREQFNLIDAGKITVDLHTTTQRISRIYATNTHADSVLTGEYPAMLEITGGTSWSSQANVLLTMQNSIQVTGGLGFHYLGNGPSKRHSSSATTIAGSEDTFTLSGKAFDSCGNLEVDAGTLDLAANASWRKGTNFVARGTGKLKFSGNRQTRSNIAKLYIEDEGKVEVASLLSVAACTVDGMAVADGEYTAATLPNDSPLKDHLTGAGTLRVGLRGGIVILR